MNVLLALPIALPLATATLLLVAPRRLTFQRVVGLVGAAGLLVVAAALLVVVRRDGIQVQQIGDWPAPYGITLVADLFSAMMVVLTGIVGLAVAMYSWHLVEPDRQFYRYFVFLHFLLMGISGAFLTGDLFNLYVWFEVMLMASFVLLALGGEHAQLEGAIKYVTINLVASAAFLAGIGILYGATGTLNMADLAGKLEQLDDVRVPTVLAMLFLVAFGIKAAVFPLFFWLPASYHTPPAAVSAVFAGLLTKVGVYALIRVFTLLFVHNVSYTHGLILVISALTMLTGVLGAVAQSEVRRILSFHIVSQIGYMVLGLAFFTPLGLAGSVFYIAHHIIVKTNLFLVAGVMEWLQKARQLSQLGGFYRNHPILGVLFLISGLSLAGIPPLSGFFAKLILIKAGLEIGQYLAVAVALLVGLLTLFSMTKIWLEAFWKAPPDRPPEPDGEAAGGPSVILPTMWLPMAGLAGITVAIGAFAGPLLTLCAAAAEQLLDRSHYVRAVLGDAP